MNVFENSDNLLLHCQFSLNYCKVFFIESTLIIFSLKTVQLLFLNEYFLRKLGKQVLQLIVNRDVTNPYDIYPGSLSVVPSWILVRSVVAEEFKHRQIHTHTHTHTHTIELRFVA